MQISKKLAHHVISHLGTSGALFLIETYPPTRCDSSFMSPAENGEDAGGGPAEMNGNDEVEVSAVPESERIGGLLEPTTRREIWAWYMYDWCVLKKCVLRSPLFFSGVFFTLALATPRATSPTSRACRRDAGGGVPSV